MNISPWFKRRSKNETKLLAVLLFGIIVGEGFYLGYYLTDSFVKAGWIV